MTRCRSTRPAKARRSSTLRSLALLRRALGSLDAVEKVLRVGVFVQCTADFTQQSEVADAASDLLHRVFGDAGVHVRTAVGVYALPKNATVEVEMTVAAKQNIGLTRRHQAGEVARQLCDGQRCTAFGVVCSR